MTREKTKPYPWRCPNCAKKTVQPATVSYGTQVKHDGRLYAVEVSELHTAKCEACGDLVFDARSEEQITWALRDKLRLLQPEQIRTQRESLMLTQRELAERIGAAAETISRWESGSLVQSRAMDNLLRLFFAFDIVRNALCGAEQQPSLGIAEKRTPAKAAAHELSEFTQIVERRLHECLVKRLGREAAEVEPDFRQRWIDLTDFVTTATELYATRPKAIRALTASFASAASRIDRLERPRHRWVVVDLCHAEPQTDRFARWLRDVAEEVDEVPEDKAERLLALMQAQFRLIIEK